MIPAAILLKWLGGFQMAMSALPKVIEIGQMAKEFFANLFSKNLISKQTQDALHSAIDAQIAMVDAGLVPDHWKVEEV